eukprot:gene7245-14780_t
MYSVGSTSSGSDPTKAGMRQAHEAIIAIDMKDKNGMGFMINDDSNRSLGVTRILRSDQLQATDVESKPRKHPTCKGLWRPEKLVGRCFGLSVSNTYPEHKDRIVESSDECRKMCCHMGEKCVSWQYQSSTKECKLGGIIRLGTEGADTHEWCEPLPPARWNGKRLSKRDSNDKCEWGEDLPNQCFGLGPERVSKNGSKLSTQECADACCSFIEDGKKCQIWQEIPGRGCFYSSADGIFCEEYKGGFEGGRKCIQGVCGGLEDTILKPFLARLNGTTT